MSEPTNPSPEPAASSGKVLPAAIILVKEVTGLVLPTTVKERLVTQLADAEIGRRVTILGKALDKRKEAQRELSKIRPEQTFDGEGKVLAESYTKQGLEGLRKAQERLTKLDKAIERAIAGEEFDKLEQLLGQA